MKILKNAKQHRKLSLGENEWNKRTSGMRTINNPSESSNGTYPVLLLFLFLVGFFDAVDALIF